MKGPLVGVALAYVGGLLLAEYIQPPLGILFPVTFGVFMFAMVWARGRSFLLCSLLVLTGWANLTSRTAILSPYDLRRVANNEPALVVVRGTLKETPDLRVFDYEKTESWRTLARLEVTELRQGPVWQPAKGVIAVTSAGVLPPEYFSGRKVEIEGILAVPPSPVAEGLFDYRAYLGRQGVYFQLKASGPTAWQIQPGGRISPGWSDRFLGWSQRILARGLPEEDDSLRLLWAMTLGWKTALTNEVSEPFMRSGTMHVFAISGLHIALIAGILVSLLRVVQVPRAWCGLLVIPLIWLYTAATGWQPSAVRSTVMMTIVIAGWALKRPGNLINSLAAAAFIILLWDPQQLFQASFQLSFFVVLIIAFLVPPLEKLCNRILQPDPMLPQSLVPSWQGWIRNPIHWLLLTFVTSVAAWLGALPLTAKYFHLVSLVALLANVVVVPCSSLALACNLGSLICGDWLPWFTELFNQSGWLWMRLMAKISQLATEVPAAYRYVSPPSAMQCVIYYGLLVGLLSGSLIKRTFRPWTILALGLMIVLYAWQWQRSRSEWELTVLPLNGAHGVWVDAAGRADDWLIDCGNTNAVQFLTAPFLRAHGINRVPRLLLTHGDLRGMGGWEMMDALFGVDEVYTSSIRFRSPKYRSLVSDLDEKSRRRILQRGDKAGCWRVMHPLANDKFAQADDGTLVLLGEIHKTRVLLLSELGRPGQELLLNREKDLRADIVVAGLPEQTEPVCDALVDAIQPRIIILADSQFPATKRANSGLTNRLARHHVPILITRATGAVTITIHKAGWEIRAMNGVRFSSNMRPGDLDQQNAGPVSD